jgi:phenylacetate-CoA ligase
VSLVRLLPRFRNAYRKLDELAEREAWSRRDIERWQLRRLNDIWSHAIDHVPYYQQLHADHQLPRSFGSLQEYTSLVPLLPRSAVKQNSKHFLSRAAESGAWHVSSGSTGAPTSFYWSHAAHHEVLQTRYRMQASWDVDIFDRTAMLWGNGAAHVQGFSGVVARVQRRFEDRLRRRLRMTAFQMDPDSLRRCLGKMRSFRPAMLYAYSTAAYLLAREAEAASLDCKSLKLCCLSAEPVLPHVVQTVERVFGVPAVVEYGATECPLIAGEGPDRQLRVREDIVLVETVLNDADRYDIVISLLTNRSFPLLRYAIGDFTDHPLTVPERGFAILGNIGGRKNDILLTGAGRPLHPLRFEFLFGFELASAVRRYRVHQNSEGAVSVLVEAVTPVPARQFAKLQRELDTLLEGYPVHLEVVDALPELQRKHFWTTSELQAVAVSST